MDRRYARLLMITAAAFALSGCGGRAGSFLPHAAPGTADMMAMPKSVSPATIPAPPMASTAPQSTASMTSRTPQVAIVPLGWTQIPGGATEAAASPDGSLWVLSMLPSSGADKYIYHYSNGTWANIPGAASRIAVAPNGDLWAVNSLGGIYRYSVTSSSWTQIQGGGSDVTVASDGTVYVVSSLGGGPFGRGIWHYTPSSSNVAVGTWVQVPGAGIRVASSWDPGTYAVPNGSITPNGIWVLNAIDGIYYFNGTTYIQIPGAAVDLAPAKNGGLFVLGVPNQGGYPIYYYDLASATWSQQPGLGFSITTDGTTVYVIGQGYGIYKAAVTIAPEVLPAPTVGYLPAGPTGGFAGKIGVLSGGGTLVAVSKDEWTSSSGNIPLSTLSLNVGSAISSTNRSPADTRAATVHEPRYPLSTDRVEDVEMLRQLHASARRAPATAPVATSYRRPQSTPVVGSSQYFWVQNSAIGTSSGSYQQVPATLEAITSHGLIWVQNSLISSGSVGLSAAATIGADFENAYTSDTTHFGTPWYTTNAPGLFNTFTACDAYGNKLGNAVPEFIPPTTSINVLVVEVVSLGKNVGGYFSSVDYMPQAIVNCSIPQYYTANTVPQSNGMPIIYVGYDSSNPSAFELQEDLVRGTAHEFQHLINFVNHLILHNGAFEDAWLNEGLSMLAQDLAVAQLYSSQGVTHDMDDAWWHAQQYLASPQTVSLTGFTSYNPNTGLESYNCNACYGLEFLFQRYLYDRFGGDTYLHAMEGSQSSMANLQAATGVPPPTLFGDFAIAMAASGRNVTADPRFGFTSVNLLASYRDQFNQTVSIGAPAPATSLTGLYNGTFLDGSFVYAAIAPGYSGANAALHDLYGGYALAGGIVQY